VRECVSVCGERLILVSLGLALVGAVGCGKEAVPKGSEEARWIGRLKATKPQERVAAAEELGRMRCEEAVDALVRALWDIRDDVRVAAAEALGRCGKEKAVDPLIALLEDEEAQPRQAGAEGLGMIGHGQQ